MGGSVICVVALLGSLEELSQGEGLSQEQIKLLKNVEYVDGWEKIRTENSTNVSDDSSQTIPKFTLANEAFDEDDNIELHHGKLNLLCGVDEGSPALSARKQVC